MIDFSNLTISNNAFKSLSQITFAQVFKHRDFTKYLTFKKGIEFNQHVGLINPIDTMGKPKTGNCNPVFDNVNITASEKKWDLQPYEVSLQLCMEDLDNYFTIYINEKNMEAYKKMSQESKNNELLMKVIMPALVDATERMMWRMCWFNDTTAKKADAGGVITPSIADIAYMQTNEGLFKRIFTIMTANPTQRVTIAANAELTYAEQKAKMYETGAAIQVMDDIVLNAYNIKGKGVIMMTDSFYQALKVDIRNQGKGSDLQFISFEGGVTLARYDAVNVIVLPEWDVNIAKYEDSGTNLNLPYRVLYTPVANLQAGTNSTSGFNKFVLVYDELYTRLSFLLKDNIDTLVAQDDMIRAAY